MIPYCNWNLILHKAEMWAGIECYLGQDWSGMQSLYLTHAVVSAVCESKQTYQVGLMVVSL